MKYILTTFLLLALTINAWAQKKYQLKSPDGKLVAAISLDDKISYAITHQGETILEPSVLNMTLENGVTWGKGSQLKSAKTTTLHQQINALFYKRNQIDDHYNELVFSFKENFNLVFRAYNEGIAYRFVST
ncbi:MAG: Retaining alpha-galactosidase, partial [Chryseobacterium sp.]